MPTHDIHASRPIMGQLRRIGLPEHLPFGRVMLYRFLDASGRLLYVGITVDPRGRWQAHKKRASWWGRVTQVRVEWHLEEHVALANERRAIRFESPLYNIRSRSCEIHETRMRAA